MFADPLREFFFSFSSRGIRQQEIQAATNAARQLTEVQALAQIRFGEGQALKFEVNKLKEELKEFQKQQADNQARLIAEVMETHRQGDRRIAEVKDSYDQAIAKLKDSSDQIIAKLKDSSHQIIAELKQSHKEGIAELKQSHMEGIAELEHSHKESIAELQEESDKRIAEREAVHQRQLEVITSFYKGRAMEADANKTSLRIAKTKTWNAEQQGQIEAFSINKAGAKAAASTTVQVAVTAGDTSIFGAADYSNFLFFVPINQDHHLQTFPTLLTKLIK